MSLTYRRIAVLFLIGLANLSQVFCPAGAAAQTTDAPAVAPGPVVATDTPAPYDTSLLRLSEILGSLHYLRNLCLETQEDQWRAGIQQLIESETNNEPKRKAQMTAAFNRGYRSFGSVYGTCTPVSRLAAEQYRNEAATLLQEITARYGN